MASLGIPSNLGKNASKTYVVAVVCRSTPALSCEGCPYTSHRDTTTSAWRCRSISAEHGRDREICKRKHNGSGKELALSLSLCGSPPRPIDLKRNKIGFKYESQHPPSVPVNVGWLHCERVDVCAYGNVKILSAFKSYSLELSHLNLGEKT